MNSFKQRGMLALYFTFSLTLSVADDGVSAEGLAGLKAFRAAEQQTYNSRDLNGLMDLFAEDIIVGSVGQPILSGRQALRDFFPGFWAEYEVVEITEVVDDHISEEGDLLIVWAHFTIRMIANGSTIEQTVGGRIFCVFRRGDDGRYRLWREAGLDEAPK